MIRSDSIASNHSNTSSRSPISRTETMPGESDRNEDEFITKFDPILLGTPTAPQLTRRESELIDQCQICSEFVNRTELRENYNIALQHLVRINAQPIKTGAFFYFCYSDELGYIDFNKMLNLLEDGKPVKLKVAQADQENRIKSIPEHERTLQGLGDFLDWYLTGP